MAYQEDITIRNDCQNGSVTTTLCRHIDGCPQAPSIPKQGGDELFIAWRHLPRGEPLRYQVEINSCLPYCSVFFWCYLGKVISCLQAVKRDSDI